MSMDSVYIGEMHKEMAYGYTTGSCAAGAAKAAAIGLLTGEVPKTIALDTPKGWTLKLPVTVVNQDDSIYRNILSEINNREEHQNCSDKKDNRNYGKKNTRKDSSKESVSVENRNTEYNISKNQFCCMIQKDSGDDPDITNGIHVYAIVSRCNSGESEETASHMISETETEIKTGEKSANQKEIVNHFETNSDIRDFGNLKIEIDGGVGVGRVTRAGLDQPIGNAAINSVPRQMIEQEVRNVCEDLEYTGALKVMICIPEGVEIAKKTFNPRLGIEGGISVLGTSGIVEPMSKKALLDTIQVELNVVRNQGYETLVIAPGNMGMDYMKTTYDYDLDHAVKCSNFVGETIDMAVALGFKKILYISHIGKAIKVAGGIMNTHSNDADCRMEILSAACLRNGLPAEHAIQILNMLTTEEAFCYLKEQDKLEKVAPYLVNQIQAHLEKRAGDGIEIGVITFSSKLGELGKTKNAITLLNDGCKNHGMN